MKIDINYSEEKESHVGVYSLTSKILESDSSLSVVAVKPPTSGGGYKAT